MITSWYQHLWVYVCFCVCVGGGGQSFVLGCGTLIASKEVRKINSSMTELRWWTNSDATDPEYKLVMRNNIINI